MKKRTSFIFLTAMILATMWVALAWAEDIVVGYTGPLSGPAAEYGQDCVNGIDMAINEINSRGGIMVKGKKYNFRFEKMDDKINPEISVSNARQLRKEHKAIAIFNPIFGNLTALMKINTEKRNEFLVMAYTSVPTVSEMGNKLTVTLTMPFTIYTKVEADLAWERGWRKCAMVVTAGAYGEAWRKAFSYLWVKKGGIITADKPANYYTRTDFAAPLAEALATEPDFLLIGGPSATTAMIIEQARAKGFEGGFVLIDQAKLDAIQSVMQKPLGMEGSIGTAKVTDVPYPATAQFIQNYKDTYKRNVTWESVINYTSMHALALAIAEAGSVDNVYAIRGAFPRVFPMLGDRYPMEFLAMTPNGRMLCMAVIQTMKFGKFTQPSLYVWWTNAPKEVEKIRKVTKGNMPVVLKID
ncbi:MAG: ABC transporter substrate-binding protein [Deltaproteobacteria bacterium]